MYQSKQYISSLQRPGQCQPRAVTRSCFLPRSVCQMQTSTKMYHVLLWLPLSCNVMLCHVMSRLLCRGDARLPADLRAGLHPAVRHQGVRLRRGVLLHSGKLQSSKRRSPRTTKVRNHYDTMLKGC